MTIKVEALQKGFCKAIKRQGEVFEIDPKLFDESWMKKIDTENAPAPMKAKVAKEKQTL